MPTIRIDHEVYAWLQSQARAFEDTPNTVLRKIAGLTLATSGSGTFDATRSGSTRSKSAPANSGASLNELWKVGAKHALYHNEGTWFENLKRFPGALFDPNGYVLFPTERDYHQSSEISIGRKTNVPSGISSLTGYVRVT